MPKKTPSTPRKLVATKSKIAVAPRQSGFSQKKARELLKLCEQVVARASSGIW